MSTDYNKDASYIKEEKQPDVYERAISNGSIVSLEDSLQQATPEEIEFLIKLLGHDHAGTIEAETEDKSFLIILKAALEMSSAEARELVTDTLVEHADDRNFPAQLRGDMTRALEEDEKDAASEGVPNDFALRACAAIMKVSSPYPEVRANAESYDDPDEYCETIRAYIVGIVWVAVGSFVNQFFTVRQPSIGLPTSLLQLFAVPSGYLLAKILPDWGFTFMGTRHSLNPGPWNYKEQSVVSVMFGVSASLAYTDSQVLVQKLPMYYDNAWATAGFQFCLLLSNQFIGFGISGIFRNILVYPSKNLWMSNFPSLALNKSFLSPDNKQPVNGWRMTRWQFFGIFFTGIFFYEWIPLYLMQFLSYFNWMTWIAPMNGDLATVTGSVTGLGFNPIPTFDWSVISFFGPLQVPFFSYCNILTGAVTGCLIILAVYYKNMYYTGYLPVNSNAIFNNEGGRYKVGKVLTDNVLDREKYEKYSPPYYSAANLVSYGAFFAAYTCIIVTSLLYDFKDLCEAGTELIFGIVGKGKSIDQYDDAHSKMMAKYKETPQWWFIVIFLISLALSLVTLKCWPTETPVWALFMALAFAVFFLVPIGILASRTNNQLSINVLVELIIGYAKPGHGTAMMLIKAYGVNANLVAITYLSDLKFGHYAKIPPRTCFRIQVVATLVMVLLVFGVLQLQLTSIKGICEPSQAATTKFTCPGETTYFSSSVIWGVIGPKRIFDAQYPVMKWCFLIGCFIPVPLFLVRYFFPKSRALLLNVEPNSMILGFISSVAPFNLSYTLPGFYVNFAFMYYVRRRFTKWFEKYNYVLASALAAGTALAAFIIFWAVQYNEKDINWWGNTVSFEGMDGAPAGYLVLEEGEVFGPTPGNYDW